MILPPSRQIRLVLESAGTYATLPALGFLALLLSRSGLAETLADLMAIVARFAYRLP